MERQTGNIVRVAVPEGRDGQAWHLKMLAPRSLWFFNCPNVIAAGAEDMLVPQEQVGE